VRPWFVAIVALIAVAGLGIAVLGTRRPPSVSPASRAAEAPAVPALEETPALRQAWRPWTAARGDRLGDPLPTGALRRFGTVRLRHGGPVRGLAVAPDGAAIVSASEDATVSFWNSATGEERLRLALGAKPSALALSPDGSRLLVGEEWQWTARLWELPGGRPLARLLPASPRRDVPAAVFAVAVAREAPLVANRVEEAVDLWSKAEGRHVRRLPGCGRGRGLAFLDRDRALLVDCPDGSFRVLEASIGAEAARKPRRSPDGPSCCGTRRAGASSARCRTTGVAPSPSVAARPTEATSASTAACGGWATTPRRGALVRLDSASRHATALRERDGLPGYIVSGIAVGEDAVWASVYALASDGVRSSGLVRFTRR
jgi:hypothetical protein